MAVLHSYSSYKKCGFITAFILYQPLMGLAILGKPSQGQISDWILPGKKVMPPHC